MTHVVHVVHAVHATLRPARSRTPAQVSRL